RVDVEPIKSLPVERHIEWQRDWARAGVVDAVKRADAYPGSRYVNEASRRSARIGIRQNAIRGQRRGTARSGRGTVTTQNDRGKRGPAGRSKRQSRSG